MENAPGTKRRAARDPVKLIGRPMQWEYQVHTLYIAGLFSTGNVNPREMQDALNYHGRHGWELVSAFDTSGGHGGSRLIVLTFKRPLAVAPPAPLPPQVVPDLGA